ncbi:MAG: hypothetical protein Q8P89_01120 [bacterium]|nr:hypothetical protein [bacterium]
MLTQKDLDEIKQLIDEEFEKRLKFLPTKDVLYEKLDGIMGELQGMRQEMTLANNRLSKHSDQLENHETRIIKIEQTSSHA